LRGWKDLDLPEIGGRDGRMTIPDDTEIILMRGLIIENDREEKLHSHEVVLESV